MEAKMRVIPFILAVLFFAGGVFAKTIIVDANGSGDFTTIQEAIDYSMDEDIIEVRPGLYSEQINFLGLEITVQSSEPDNLSLIESTIIKYDSSAPTVTFDSGESNKSILKGLTIKGGRPGIYCYYSSPTIINCLIRGDGYYSIGIEGNNALPLIADCDIKMLYSTSVAIWRCDGLITGCRLTENSIGLEQCYGTIENCEISDNFFAGIADCNSLINNCIITKNGSGPYDGGGIKWAKGGTIENCTVSDNFGIGIERSRNEQYTNLLVKNCIVTDNSQYGIAKEVTYVPMTLKYNNVYGNVLANYDNIAPGESQKSSFCF